MKTPIRFLIIINFLLLVATVGSAQKEDYIWYFGNGAGLNFNTPSPTALTNGSLFLTYDNSSTVSDTAGNFLFYTTGSEVYNANMQVMANGYSIGGSNTGGQAALIVKQPYNDSLYYIFTADAFGASGGLKYSIVNMNNGLGAVTQKGIVLLNPSTEKLAAYYSCRDKCAWLIAHRGNSNDFCCYKINVNGLDTVPVISSVGSIHPTGQYGVVNNTAGQMSISKGGNRIACVQYTSGKVEVFDFNSTTGVVSNQKLLPTLFPYGWGIEFSPDETKLYLSVYNSPIIRQFDATLNTGTDIAASVQTIGTITTPACPGYAGATGYLQRGPDDKIYIAKCNSQYLSVINNPDLPGASCNLIDSGVSLGSSYSYFGLSRALVKECATTDVKQFAITALFSFSPNPNNGTFILNMNDIRPSEKIRLKIYNTLGKLVYSEDFITAKKEISTDLKSGFYTMEISLNNQVYFKKMMVY